jgi:hypothetical protein
MKIFIIYVRGKCSIVGSRWTRWDSWEYSDFRAAKKWTLCYFNVIGDSFRIYSVFFIASTSLMELDGILLVASRLQGRITCWVYYCEGVNSFHFLAVASDLLFLHHHLPHSVQLHLCNKMMLDMARAFTSSLTASCQWINPPPLLQWWPHRRLWNDAVTAKSLQAGLTKSLRHHQSVCFPLMAWQSLTGKVDQQYILLFSRGFMRWSVRVGGWKWCIWVLWQWGRW